MNLVASLRNIFLVAFILLAVACGDKKDTKSYLDIPDPKTLGETFVSNPDNILSPETVADLNQTLQALDASGRAHIDVLVVESIGDAVPKDAVTALFRKWKIGAKETNNGLLILVVNDQHRIEFETGYGLEGDLPDITCYHIQQQYMVPHAKNNDLNFAVREGVAATIRQLQTGDAQMAAVTDTTASAVTDTAITAQDSMVYAEPLAIVPAEDNTLYINEPQGDAITLILIVVFIIAMCLIDKRLMGETFKYRIISPLFWLTCLVPIAGMIYLNIFHQTEWYDTRAALMFYAVISIYLSLYYPLSDRITSRKIKDKTRYEQYVILDKKHYNMAWCRYIFPLPFLLVYWRRYTSKMGHLRNDPYPCKICGKGMTKLEETNDDEYLEKGNVAEEVAQSVDYDVWVCNDNSHPKEILIYKNLSTKAIKCPKCSYLTLMPDGKEVVVHATTSSEGWGWVKQRCHFCNHREQVRYTIPQVSSSSSSGG
ncbi:MAG: TPM domain-containing protein, partial [Mucilaginibacter sp.]